jgi:hypothetical protein
MECSTLFVVRVWRQIRRGRSTFRASVRAVDAEQERLFTRSAELARFLSHASDQSEPPDDPSIPTLAEN